MTTTMIDVRGRAELPRALKTGAGIKITTQGGAYRIDLSSLTLADDAPSPGDITIGFRADGSAYRASLVGLIAGAAGTQLLDALLNALPTTVPTTSGTWWNNNGTFAKTP